MKTMLCVLWLSLMTAVAGFGQSNQAFPQKEIWASDYSTWQVKSTAPNTYQWQPSSLCQFPIPNAPGNFNAFNQNGPVYIQDSDTTKSEVLAPNFVILNGNLCEVALTTVHTHDSFALMSGTAGLQEALNTIPANIPYAVQVILDRNWYTALHSTPGQVAATVIGSVKGSTAAILADWTQAPTQFYRWNGSQYVAVGSGGVSGLTAQHIPVATSPTALVDSAMTDDGTTLTYPHSGGFVVPKVIFGGSVASGNYGIIGFGSPIGAYPYIQFFSTSSGGTTIDSTGVYSQALHAGTGNVSGGSLLISGIATVSTLQNGTPGVPIVINQNGGGVVTEQVNGGLDITGALELSNGFGASGDVATSTGSGSPAHWAAAGSGNPGGAPNQLQINVAGAFGADPTLSFDLPSHTLLMLNGNLAANGIATQANNQNSGTLVMEADVCTVAGVTCIPGGVFYGQQVIASTGPNPLTLMNYNCSSTSTGPCGANFNYPIFSSNNIPTGDKSTAVASQLNVYNNMPMIAAQYFGAYGDAFKPPDGLSTTASSTTVGCPDGCFVPGDVGKDFWVSGAGPSGAAFHATITAVSGNTTATVSVAATATVTNGPGVYGHDDLAAVQACIKYSSVNAVNCVLKPMPAPVGQSGLVGYLIGSGTLHLTSNNFLEENSGPNIIGNSQSNGTNLFCEVNAFCLDLESGPIQGATLKDLAFEEDPTQPNSAGLHFNPQVGTFGNGPFTNSNLTHVNVDNPSKECVWFDGGGGPGYTFNLPNQYIQLDQFWCSGPNQSHPSSLILMTGQAAQIDFRGGQVNGCCWNGSTVPNYPNPMIKITEKTSTLGDTPVDVKFFGYTFEVGTQGLYIGNGANNIHYDNSYVENVASPFIVNQAVANTFNGNHIANSGNVTAVYQFAGGTPPNSAGGSIRDNLVYGGVADAALAVCTGNVEVDPQNNNATVPTTSGCVTAAVSTGSSSLTIPEATTASVTASGGAIQTISAPRVASGKTLTLYSAAGFQLATGGNVALGNYTSPLTIPAGGSVTLTLLDASVTWLVTSGPPPALGALNWSTIVHGTNTDSGAFSTNGAWSYHQGPYFDSNSGTQAMQFGPGSTPGSSSTCMYDDGNYHIDGTCNGNRGLFFKGQFSTSYIAAFAPASGTQVLEVGLNGSLLNPAGNFQAIRGPSNGPAALDGLRFSAGGTPVPTCNSTIVGYLAVVDDATAPTYMGAYTSGGGITAAVICSFDGTTYVWKTH